MDEVVVCWPEIQYLMEQEGFEENCELIVSGKDYERYGDCSYYVDVEWLKTLDVEIRSMFL